MLIILFGKPGSGKNFVGEILQQDYGFHYHDLDADLTLEIKTLIKEQKIIPLDVRIKIFNVFIEKIRQLQQHYQDVAVSQAIVKEVNREMLHKAFPKAMFILVTADNTLRHARLTSRSHIVNKEYAEKVDKIFEDTQIPHQMLYNNNDRQEIIKQLDKLIKVKW